MPVSRLPAGAAALVLAASLTATTASAQAPSLPTAETPVVVIVRVAKPWYAPRAVVTGKMRDTMPEYARLPGLLFKAFSFEQASSDFGGVYFWRDRAAADAWFDAAWFERVRRERGVDALVRTWDAPVSIDNTAGGTQTDADSKAIATLVEIPIPAGVTRERLVGEFTAAVPTYRKIPGLLRKHFTIGAQGTFGGVYLWKDEASARAWFGDAWHARVVATYGRDATIEWFDTPILLPTQDAAGHAVAQAMPGARP